MPRRRQRRRTEQTRRALLAAARSLFRERGYARTSVAEITREAGRAHGTFYLYFDNKRDLFSALLAEMGEGITARAREEWRASSPTQAVLLGVRRFFDDVAANQHLWRLLEEMAANDASFALLRTSLRETFAEQIQRGIERSRAKATQHLDPAVLAHLLTAVVMSFARVGRLPTDAQTLALHITTVWARGLGYPAEDVQALWTEARTG